MSKVNFMLRRTRLALQEFGPSMLLLTMPGGYLAVLMGWLYHRLPLSSITTR
jgi:hypothetical protein